MSKLYSASLVFLMIFICFASASCHSSLFSHSALRSTERQIAGTKRSTPKVKEPRKVLQAKKQQEKRQAKIDRDYDKFVKNSRKRSYEIQSPDVKARMKQDQSNISARDKARGKKIRSASKNRARKFR